VAVYSSQKPIAYDRYQRAALEALPKRGGIGHTTDLLRDGTRTTAITSLWRPAQLIRLKAGLYQLPEALSTQHAAIVQACAAVPNGVVAPHSPAPSPGELAPAPASPVRRHVGDAEA